MATQKLRRRSRLLKPADFTKVFKQAVASSDHYFKVLACSGEISGSRLGMAVSRKVDSRAVARNRIKRVIRESFRKTVLPAQASHGDGNPGCDIVVLARGPASQATNAELTASLDAHWQQIERKLSNERRRSTSGNADL